LFWGAAQTARHSRPDLVGLSPAASGPQIRADCVRYARNTRRLREPAHGWWV